MELEILDKYFCMPLLKCYPVFYLVPIWYDKKAEPQYSKLKRLRLGRKKLASVSLFSHLQSQTQKIHESRMEGLL